MHSGQSCGAKSIVARDTGLITPGKKNIYNATFEPFLPGKIFIITILFIPVAGQNYRSQYLDYLPSKIFRMIVIILH